MKLTEIELDLPYKTNEEFVSSKLGEMVDYQAALKMDYERNWKEKRREFQLMTRCMTSMVERMMEPIGTKDCWKILVECVEMPEYTNYRNLLGVYVIQAKMNLEVFYSAGDDKKKEMIVDIILEGVEQLSKYVSFSLHSISDACMKIAGNNYINEWTWKKAKINKKIVAIWIEHGLREVNVFMKISSGDGTMLKKELIISTLPDEWAYSQYLGKLMQISENLVALIDKSGKEVMRSEV